MSNIFSEFQERYEVRQDEEMSIQDYLESCKTDKSFYANAAERMLMAIGDPTIVDTRTDERLSRIFTNRKIKTYESSEVKFCFRNCAVSSRGNLDSTAPISFLISINKSGVTNPIVINKHIFWVCIFYPNILIFG